MRITEFRKLGLEPPDVEGGAGPGHGVEGGGVYSVHSLCGWTGAAGGREPSGMFRNARVSRAPDPETGTVGSGNSLGAHVQTSPPGLRRGEGTFFKYSGLFSSNRVLQAVAIVSNNANWNGEWRVCVEFPYLQIPVGMAEQPISSGKHRGSGSHGGQGP